MNQIYMLDTNIFSAVVKDANAPAGKALEAASIVNTVGVSIITAAELRFGTAKKGSQKLLDYVEALLGTMEVFPLAPPVDAHYGGIRSELEAAGQPIGSNDLFIAAHAIALDAILVTNNEREFRRVRGLRIENWITE